MAKRTDKKSPAGRKKTPAPTGPALRSGSREPTASDKVYNFVLDKIITREWPIHTKIMTEPELAAAVGAGRMAVREGVERLCTLGLLVKRQGAGTYVSEPHVTASIESVVPLLAAGGGDVRQMLEFRRFFEYGNVVMFTQNAEPADIKALEDNYRAMISLASGDIERSGALDYEYHHILAVGTKNRFSAQVSEMLLGIMKSHRGILYHTSVTQGNAIVYHGEILRAVKNRDGDVAAMLMRRHLDVAIELLDKKDKRRADD